MNKGEIITFGAFPQSAAGAAAEPLEWTVLDVKDGAALLITAKAIDCRQYHGDNTTVTWETCDLRKWLNGEFFENTFSADEKAAIQVTATPNPNSTVHGANGGNDTEDKVFLLNVDEASALFADDESRKAEATPYAVAKGAFINERTGKAWWWLRSPGYYVSDAAGVNYLGQVHKSGDNVSATNDTVRPAIWVKA